MTIESLLISCDYYIKNEKPHEWQHDAYRLMLSDRIAKHCLELIKKYVLLKRKNKQLVEDFQEIAEIKTCANCLVLVPEYHKYCNNCGGKFYDS